MNRSEDSRAAIDPAGAAAHEDLAEDPRVFEVVQEYWSRIERGEKPDRAACLRRYPELADAVAHCLEGLELLQHELPSSSSDSRKSRPPVAAGLSGPPLSNPLGDFQIIRELGRGGMGVVYEALQLSLGRRVALKVLPFAATFDARQLQRFKNEAQAAALLHHTHIVPIYAVGSERGVHFYAMQLIEGHSLATVIEQMRAEAGLRPARHHTVDLPTADRGEALQESGSQSPTETPVSTDAVFSPQAQRSTTASAVVTAGAAPESEPYFRRIARLLVQAGSALDHAHQLGVVHRDVKPANLLVDAAGNLWVTDFGLAQFQTEMSLTRSGDLLGTFRYMSPEQTSGQRALLDHRTDIYSLGATFYEMLTLEPVFDGETRQELLYQILHNEPRPLRSVRRSVPPELETIILKALSKNSAERYASAADLAEDVQRYLDHEPIRARRPSPADRLRKWSRRHPSVVVTGVLLLSVVAVALFISNRLISAEQQKTAIRAAEAEERFNQARHAVDLLIQVAEEELADKPPLDNTRKRLLETALAYYQDFIEQRSGNAASQGELEAVERRVKGILRELSILQREMSVMLLENSAVCDELQLNATQRTEIARLLEQWDSERSALFASSPQAERQALRQRFVRLAEEHDRALGRVLTAAQRERLTQIEIQCRGVFAFQDAEVIRQLEITADQQKAIREVEFRVLGFRFERIGSGGHAGERGHRIDGPDPGGQGLFGELRGPGGPVPFGGPARVQTFHVGPGGRPERPNFIPRQKSIEMVLALLNPEQVERWRALTGAPVENLDVLLFRRHPGDGPRPHDNGEEDCDLPPDAPRHKPHKAGNSHFDVRSRPAPSQP